MSDTDRDPQMTRYLTQSAVPDHAPEFWDNLDRQMDTIDHGNPKAALLDSTPSIAPLEERQRDQAEVTRLAERPGPSWRRGIVLAAVAAAVVGVLSFVTQRGGGEGSQVRLDPGSVSTTAPFTNPTAQSEAISVTMRFVDALTAGNIAEARAALGSRSEAYLSGATDGVDPFLRGAQNSFADFASTANPDVWALATGVNEYVVVLKNGDKVQAIPVIKAESAQAWFVEPWALDPDGESRLDVSYPDMTTATPTMKPEQSVTIFAPQAGDLLFGLDRDALDPVPTRPYNQGDGAPALPRADWELRSPAVGNHTLVIVYKTDKILSALARTIEIV